MAATRDNGGKAPDASVSCFVMFLSVLVAIAIIVGVIEIVKSIF